jgi:serine protease Do
VDLESPADRIGLLEGDEIIAFEDTPVETLDALVKLLGKRLPGEKVTLRIKRGKEELTLEPILDARPATGADSFSRAAAQRDGRLSSLSARGGDLSDRRDGFPRTLYHDQPLRPNLAGTPVVNLEGKVVGINIARAMRHRSLAIPTIMIDEVVARLRAEAARN